MSDPSNLTIKNITDLFQNRVLELQEEPEFQWKRESIKYALDDNGNPSVKVAIARAYRQTC